MCTISIKQQAQIRKKKKDFTLEIMVIHGKGEGKAKLSKLDILQRKNWELHKVKQKFSFYSLRSKLNRKNKKSVILIFV